MYTLACVAFAAMGGSQPCPKIAGAPRIQCLYLCRRQKDREQKKKKKTNEERSEKSEHRCFCCLRENFL